LTDVVYGIVVWRFFAIIPKPAAGDFGIQDLTAYLSNNFMVLLISVIGILVTVIYWIQNNTLSAQLERTDGRHTGLSIFQLFFLMIFLFSLKFGIDHNASPLTRAFESGTAACMGVFAGLGFSYAVKNRRLLLPEVSDADARKLSIRAMAEPITAVFTLLFVFTPILWELSWLAYPLVVKLISRKAR
jgi:uncharacterized membrane protein